MVIETKFELGDEVWCIHNDKAVKTKTVIISSTQKDLEDISWQLELEDIIIPSGGGGLSLPLHKAESKLFKTKEELIQSL